MLVNEASHFLWLSFVLTALFRLPIATFKFILSLKGRNGEAFFHEEFLLSRRIKWSLDKTWNSRFFFRSLPLSASYLYWKRCLLAIFSILKYWSVIDCKNNCVCISWHINTWHIEIYFLARKYLILFCW